MTLGILYGLIAALSYGASSVVARFCGKETGVLPTLLWSQVFLLGCSTVALFALGAKFNAPALSWLALGATNLCIVAGTGCLYRGLTTGRVSIVAPVMAAYGAVSAVLSWLSGDRPGWTQVVGLVLTIVGAVASAITGKPDSTSKTSGLHPAIAAALLFGVGYWAQGTFVLPAFGPMATLWLYYISSTIVFSAAVLVTRRPVLTIHAKHDLALLLTTAALGGGGFAATMMAQATGDIAVATALSSASTAITVLLSFILTKDRPTILGCCGVACVVVGVGALQLASH